MKTLPAVMTIPERILCANNALLPWSPTNPRRHEIHRTGRARRGLWGHCRRGGLRTLSSDGASPSGAAVLAPSRLARLEREVRGLLCDKAKAGLPDGLVPSEAKVRGLAWEAASPGGASRSAARWRWGRGLAANLELRRGKPVGGCGGVGGGGLAANLEFRRGKPVGGCGVRHHVGLRGGTLYI
jgi:hypothetical protein